MLIQVIYSNKRTGLVKQADLDRLLADSSLAAFRRAGSWAIIGRDPIRAESSFYSGGERRGLSEENSGSAAFTPEISRQERIDAACATS